MQICYTTADATLSQANVLLDYYMCGYYGYTFLYEISLLTFFDFYVVLQQVCLFPLTYRGLHNNIGIFVFTLTFTVMSVK